MLLEEFNINIKVRNPLIASILKLRKIQKVELIDKDSTSGLAYLIANQNCIIPRLAIQIGSSNSQKYIHSYSLWFHKCSKPVTCIFFLFYFSFSKKH